MKRVRVWRPVASMSRAELEAEVTALRDNVYELRRATRRHRRKAVGMLLTEDALPCDAEAEDDAAP